MGRFFTYDSVKWALINLSNLPKDQTGILFYLIFSKLAGNYNSFRLDSRGRSRQTFEEEFLRYFSGHLADGTPVPFDPFSNNWRADNYIQSTVFGRVINGSHWWTNPERGFISRDPATGWPAEFIPHPEALIRLRIRTTPPNLVSSNKIPLIAMTAWYYRFEDISDICETDNVLDVVKHYLSSLHLKPNTAQLIFSDVRETSGSLQVNNYMLNSVKTSAVPLTREEAGSIFPSRTQIIELRKNIRVFDTDFDKIRRMKISGEDDADVIRRLIQFYDSMKRQ